MRPPSCAALLLALCAPAVVLAGGAASAQTAPTPDPSPAASPSPSPAVVRVGDADSGGTVHLVPGQQLRVELGPADAPWQGLEASTPGLQVLGYTASRSGLGVSLLALAAAPAQRLSAEAGDRRWTLDLAVDDGPARQPRTCPTAPGPTGTPAASATAVPSATPTTAPRGLTLSAGSDGGGPYRISTDDPVSVTFDSCTTPYGPVVVSGVLRRDQASASLADGQAEADLVPTGAGTATLTAQRDTPCAATTSGSCPPPWQVVVEVACALTVTGPATAPSGTTAVLTGRAQPGEAVTVLFRRRGESSFTARRSLQAGPDGAFSTSFAATDDQRWYAAGERCSSLPGLTQVTPAVTGPDRVARGATARLVARGAAGSEVRVLFRRAGSATWRTGRSGTADAGGRFVTSFRPDVDHAYYATSLGRRSAAAVTQAR